MNLLIIGQNPGRMRTTDPREVPVHKALYRWCDTLGFRYYSFVNVQHRMTAYHPTEEEEDFLEQCVKKHSGPILVLGNKAWRTMRFVFGPGRAGAFLAPHPSGLNRQFNDGTFESLFLEHVKKYLAGKIVYRRV